MRQHAETAKPSELGDLCSPLQDRRRSREQLRTTHANSSHTSITACPHLLRIATTCCDAIASRTTDALQGTALGIVQRRAIVATGAAAPEGRQREGDAPASPCGPARPPG